MKRQNQKPPNREKETLNQAIQFQDRVSRSRGKHEGESSAEVCDRLCRTRVVSQRQLPTDHDYAVSTREYQTDQSSLKSAPAAARSVLGKKQKQRQLQKQPHRFRKVDTVTPYQGKSLVVLSTPPASCRLAGLSDTCLHLPEWLASRQMNLEDEVHAVISVYLNQL